MAPWLRYGWRAAGLVGLLRSTQGSLRHELEVHRPRYGGVEQRVEILSDSDLSDIYAYLESVPKPRPVSEIPLLRQ